MAEIVQANYESLAAVAKRFAQQANRIQQLYSRVHRQMSLLRPAWIGKGSEAFFAEMSDKVLPGVQRLSAALAEADRVTRQIQEILSNAEEQGSSPFLSDTGGGAGGSEGGGGSGAETGGAGGYDEGVGSGGGTGGAGGYDEGGSGSGDETGGAGGYDEGGGGSGDETGGAGGYDEGGSGSGDETGGAGGYDEGGGGSGSETGGAGGYGGGGSGDSLGDDYTSALDDFSKEYSTDNLGGGSGGAWSEDSYQPPDQGDSTFDQIQDEYAYGDTGSGGGIGGGSGGGGFDGGLSTLEGGDALDYAVPEDWLSGVEDAYGSPWSSDLGDSLGGGSDWGNDGLAHIFDDIYGEDAADGSALDAMGGGAGGGDMSGASGGGGDMGGGSGGGESGGGGSPMGGASPSMAAEPSAGAGSPTAAGEPASQGGGVGASGQGAAVPGALRYQTLGGGAARPAVAQTGGSVTAPAAAQAAQPNMGVPMGLAALGPLLALVGKAIKDRASGQ